MVLDEMIRVRFEQPNGPPHFNFVEMESDRLAPGGTMSKSERAKINLFYLQLQKYT